MQWTDDEATDEFSYLKLMGSYKYDYYQGFQPGTRFWLALIGWLSQFNNKDDRDVAYSFLKNNLVFFSQREMNHLVGLLMPKVDRIIHKEVADQLNIPLYQALLNADAIKLADEKLQRTLFIGLSDGARIDVFRRFNEGRVSNEQVLVSHEISEAKWKDLNENLVKIDSNSEAHFERFCLVDDFTGSGSSLIRFDEKKIKWAGKMNRFCDLYEKWHPSSLNGFKWKVQIHHYIASDGARKNIEENLKEFEKTRPKFSFKATFSYLLPEDVITNNQSNSRLVTLLKGYYDKNIEDEHTGPDIWYGYRQSGLPVVLEHNTPNNSLALLWAESDKDESPINHEMKPLFIRRKRHSSHG